jgi:O-antigen ligase
MVLTASRSALLAFMGLIAVGIFHSKHRMLNSLIVVIIMIVGWIILPQQYHDRYMRFSEVGEDMNDVSSGRIDIWISGIKMIPTNPITGVGAGAFAWACATGDFGPPRFMQSHNLYIEIISSMGIIGVIAWLFFILTLFRKLRWLTLRNHTSRSHWISLYSRAFIVTLIALLISGVFGHNLYRYTWYMIAGLTLALSNIWNSEYAHEDTNS